MLYVRNLIVDDYVRIGQGVVFDIPKRHHGDFNVLKLVS